MLGLKDYLVLDTETTALPHENGSIVEIAILEVRNSTIVDKLHFLLNPTTPMTAGASLANGIDESELENCPTFKQVEPEITAWLSLGLPILAYNGDRFDKEMIRMEYSRMNIQAPESKWVDVYKIVCNRYTLVEVHDKTGLKSRKQTNMAAYFKVNCSGAHRAMADVIMLDKIYKKISEENRKVIDSERKSLAVVNNEAKDEKSADDKFKDDKFKDDTPTSKAISVISRVDAKLILANSIATAGSLSVKFADKIAAYAKLSVTNQFTFEESTFAIGWLESTKKDITKERTDTLHKIKSAVSLVEELYREILIKPIDAALQRVTSERKVFVQKKFEAERAAAEEKKREIEKIAEEASQKVFEKVSLTKGVDQAVKESETVYSNISNERNNVEVNTKNTTKTSLGKVVDTIVYSIKVVDAAAVPKKWLTPDIDKITAFVNETNGEIGIPGIEIISETKTKFSKR